MNATQSRQARNHTVITLEELRPGLLGQWVSIAPEARPSKNSDGTMKPFFLSRSFVCLPEDRFTLTVVNYGDPYGEVSLARMDMGGHMSWGEEHPIAPGARQVDFVADEAYGVTPLVQAFADLLNNVATDGYARWNVGQKQDILRKSFPPFRLTKGQPFKEYDLVYLASDLLFWGARHVDGRGFDTEANRPTNLQIPLVRG
jgi:hypothetical protein